MLDFAEYPQNGDNHNFELYDDISLGGMEEDMDNSDHIFGEEFSLNEGFEEEPIQRNKPHKMEIKNFDKEAFEGMSTIIETDESVAGTVNSKSFGTKSTASTNNFQGSIRSKKIKKRVKKYEPLNEGGKIYIYEDNPSLYMKIRK